MQWRVVKVVDRHATRIKTSPLHADDTAGRIVVPMVINARVDVGVVDNRRVPAAPMWVVIAFAGAKRNPAQRVVAAITVAIPITIVVAPIISPTKPRY